MSETAAHVIVATLTRSGVRRIYGLPGGSISGFPDELRRDGAIGRQHVRHEEAAAFAAAGAAAVTGELAFCAATCGPGRPPNGERRRVLRDRNEWGAPNFHRKAEQRRRQTVPTATAKHRSRSSATAERRHLSPVGGRRPIALATTNVASPNEERSCAAPLSTPKV